MPPETNPEGFVWIPEIMIVKEGEQGVVWFVLHCPVSHNTESSFPCSLRDTATLKSKVKSFWFSMIADASLSMLHSLPSPCAIFHVSFVQMETKCVQLYNRTK